MHRVEVERTSGRYRVKSVLDDETGEVLKSGTSVDITWHQRSNLSPTLTVRVDGHWMQMGTPIQITIRSEADDE